VDDVFSGNPDATSTAYWLIVDVFLPANNDL
jgi:hypothetical protein